MLSDDRFILFLPKLLKHKYQKDDKYIINPSYADNKKSHKIFSVGVANIKFAAKAVKTLLQASKQTFWISHFFNVHCSVSKVYFQKSKSTNKNSEFPSHLRG